MKEQKSRPATLPFEDENLFELSVIGFVLVSRKGIIIKANNAAKTLFNHTLPLEGIPFTRLFVNEPPEKLRNLLTRKEEKLGQKEFTALLGDEKTGTFWANVHITSLSCVQPPNPCSLCQIINVSELKQATEDASHHIHLINELINNIPDNIFIKDVESRFILANKSVCGLMGAGRTDNLIGKTDFEFYPRKLAQKYRNDELKVMRTGKAQISLVEQVIDTEHNRHWFSTSKIPLRNSHGEIIGIMGVGRDITDLVKEKKALKKAKLAAEKADQLKSAFLSNLSHEVRTPLNGILGFSQFLKEKSPKDSKTSHYIEYIIRNGKRLLHLITDIVDLSKLESDQLVLNKKRFSLSELMRKMEMSLHLLLEQEDKRENIEPHMVMDSVCKDIYLFQDDQRLEQVLYALLSNAVKFTEKGTILLTCECKSERVCFSVKDTGIGIEEKNLNQIFDRFTQVDNTMARQYEGAGLGLTLVRELLKLMNGSIQVKSIPGKGSEFRCTIPS